MKISWGDIRQGRAYRALAFIGKGFLVLITLFYVYTGSVAMMTLVKKESVRQQDIGILAAVIQESIDARKPESITEWVRFRPMEETDALITALKPASGKMGPDIFFELFRRKLQQDKTEDALFWLQLARFRLRYDTLRCGDGAHTAFLDGVLKAASSQKIETLLLKDPSLVKKSVRQVMDFDARYPADNDPSLICNMIEKISRGSASPLPRKKWTPLRTELHSSTEAALKKMDGKQKK